MELSDSVDLKYLQSVLEKTRTRLLDKTRRNRLLNFKETARDVAIIDEMPDQVFEHLVLNGNTFYFDYYDPPEVIDEDQLKLLDAGKPPGPTRVLPEPDPTNENPEPRYTDNRLQTPFLEKELERRLRKLYLDHRMMIEETGANNLYLSIGFLEWHDSRENTQRFLSPLIMVPVRMERERKIGGAKYSILFDDEALDTNYSLYEKLIHDFDISLPELQEDQCPEKYLKEVEFAIDNRKANGWKIIREMSLCFLRFNKQIMWHDLNTDRWPKHTPLTDKNVLKRILIGSDEENKAPRLLTEEYSQDNNDNASQQKLKIIMDADSSQIAALIDALNLEDGLVIEGPPGTGKSQTITNLIAAALYQGMSVLFMAEKMAALEVVFKRLAETGLDDYCLQLHGLKTSKKELLWSVKKRINQDIISHKGLIEDDESLLNTKKELLNFSKVMSEPIGPEEIPLYMIVWRVERLKQMLPNGFIPIFVNSHIADLNKLNSDKILLDNLAKEWGAIPELVRVSWKGFLPAKNLDDYLNSFLDTIIDLIKAMDEIYEWLNNHDIDDHSSSLLQVGRLLKIGELYESNALPPLPSGADIALIHRIAHKSLLEPFGEIIEKLERYLNIVSDVNKVFDYASENASKYAANLKTHSSRLANVVCSDDVTINHLPKEKENIDKVIAFLQSFQNIAKPVLNLNEGYARTIDDYRSLVNFAKQLSDGPTNLSIYGNPIHVKVSATNHFKEAQKKFLQIISKADELKEFHLERTQKTATIKEAYEDIILYKDSWIPILYGNYRQAKKTISGILRRNSTYSRNIEFLNRLRKLVDFCSIRDEFAETKNYQISLGPLFNGIETDWVALEDIINYSQALRERVGSEKAKTILKDWDSHIEIMQTVQEQLGKALKYIEEYINNHCLPDSLWQRPIQEISSTLKPWSEKINTTVATICQPWCNIGITLKEAIETVETYRMALDKEHEIERHPEFDELLKDVWDGPKTNYQLLKSTFNWINDRLSTKGINIEVMKWLLPSPVLFRKEYFEELIRKTRPFHAGIATQLTEFKRYGQVDINDWIGGANNSLKHFQGKLSSCEETISSLPLLVRWHAIHKQVCDAGLGAYAELVSDNILSGDECSRAFEYSFYSSILENEVKDKPMLDSFGHASFENLRERFAQLDKEMLNNNAQHIAARLRSTPVPEGIGRGKVSDWTEKRLLEHEAGKRSRHIPIRQLIKRSKNALQALKPCFLMSPLSVAQYLPPGEIEFDLVVMDEASQIRPEDSLGAIARARKAIIVGDPKQLPPTSFFDSSFTEDEEGEETIMDDTESILDVCLKQFPYRRLRWHYRSQHESLIQFSNDKFYEGDLIIFPSPKGNSREFGVHSTYIEDPSYRNGRNRREAEFVVENIIHHFHRHTKKSLGVAAFNKRQAEEIQLLLDRARNDDPALDELIAEHEANEPLFIKNLENVQGDERDVIFISTTYGPEKQGAQVYQRFGPLNSELGWRRLNVIATRAKQRVEVFTSLRPSDIRIGDGSRRGVRTFRDYLEYASTGQISDHGRTTGREPDSEFEVSVIHILNSIGYECEPQVGVAGFFIDIGVKNPDKPGEYLLGIECDGAAYHSAKSVRDRDRLRQEILESKGWLIHRIWSTSWYHTRAAEIDRLKHIIKEKLAEERRIWERVSDFEDEPEVLTKARQVTQDELQREAEDLSESLELSLERFWEWNIKPDFQDRSRSILNINMIALLTDKKPISKEEWFSAVPIEMRENLNPKELVYLEDILEEIADYA